MRQGSTAARLEGKKAALCLSALQHCVSAFLPCCLAALSLTSAACHRVHANTLLESPPLEVPAVPPREVEPIEVETPQPMPLPEEPAKPPALLQTTPPNTEGDLERGIRASLTRAQTDLNRIDTARLNADARGQYETAKTFIRQAEQAVRAKNLLFAKIVADKAAALAAQLAPK